MPDDHAAFRAGEHVLLADAATLQHLQEKFGVHPMTPLRMAEHADKPVRIRRVSSYHFGTTLYEFDEVPGHWLEQTIVDPCLGSDYRDTHPIYEPADQTYLAAADVESGPGFVSISDRSGRIFRRSHHNDAVRTATDINTVAHLRCRASFEALYGFDGVYEKVTSCG